MKSYFENEYCIIPFDKVKDVEITNTYILVKAEYEFTIEQLANYKQWIEMKQQALEDRIKPIYAKSPLPQISMTNLDCITTLYNNNPKITEEYVNYIYRDNEWRKDE